MQFDQSSNIYNKDGYLTDGILINYHYNYLNGNLSTAIAVEYHKNQMNGFYKTFDESGKLISDRTFENGMLHGFSRFYDQLGNLILIDEYDNGQKIKSESILVKPSMDIISLDETPHNETPHNETPHDEYPIAKKARRIHYSMTELD